MDTLALMERGHCWQAKAWRRRCAGNDHFDMFSDLWTSRLLWLRFCRACWPGLPALLCAPNKWHWTPYDRHCHRRWVGYCIHMSPISWTLLYQSRICFDMSSFRNASQWRVQMVCKAVGGSRGCKVSQATRLTSRYVGCSGHSLPALGSHSWLSVLQKALDHSRSTKGRTECLVLQIGKWGCEDLPETSPIAFLMHCLLVAGSASHSA